MPDLSAYSHWAITGILLLLQFNPRFSSGRGYRPIVIYLHSSQNLCSTKYTGGSTGDMLRTNQIRWSCLNRNRIYWIFLHRRYTCGFITFWLVNVFRSASASKYNLWSHERLLIHVTWICDMPAGQDIFNWTSFRTFAHVIWLSVKYRVTIIYS